jgi:hypothetical protein
MSRNHRSTVERSAGRQVIIGALWLAAVLLVGIVVIWFTGDYARARGGGIESTAMRSGRAIDVTCEKNAISLDSDWSCSCDRIEWVSKGSVPAEVAQQRPPYRILSSTDVSGPHVSVTSHAPMGWETAGSGRRSELPVEVIVA